MGRLQERMRRARLLAANRERASLLYASVNLKIIFQFSRVLAVKLKTALFRVWVLYVAELNLPVSGVLKQVI